MYINESLYLKYIVLWLFKFYSIKSSQLKVFFFTILKFQSCQFSSCHFMGLQKRIVKFHKGGGEGIRLSCCELLKFFVSIFWSSKIFNFLRVILGSSSFFVWSFTKWGNGNGVCVFFMWTSKVFYFYILKFLNLFLSFWGSLMFCVKFHKGGNRIFAFLLETSKVFCFEVFNFLPVNLGVFENFVWSFHKQGKGVCAFLHVNFEIFFGFFFSKFWNLQFSSCYFGCFKWGEIMLGALF